MFSTNGPASKRELVDVQLVRMRQQMMDNVREAAIIAV